MATKYRHKQPDAAAHAAALLGARRYEALASTYRPFATRTTGEPTRALLDKTPLTEDLEMGSRQGPRRCADLPDVHRRTPLGENGEHGRLHPAGTSRPDTLRSRLPPGIASLPYGRQLGNQPLESITDLRIGEDGHQLRQSIDRLRLVPVAPA